MDGAELGADHRAFIAFRSRHRLRDDALLAGDVLGVRMKRQRQPFVRAGQRRIRHAEVEEHERLDPHELVGREAPRRRRATVVERMQRLRFEVGTAVRFEYAGHPGRARPRLVHELGAEQERLVGEARDDRLDALDEVLLQADAAGPFAVRPEILEGALHGRVLDVVQREHRVGRIRQAVADRHPVGQAVAVEHRREAVLMEVHQHEDAARDERRDGLGEVLDVGVLDHARRRHQAAEVDAEAQRVEALGLQERGVIVGEPERARIERVALRDHVHAVQDHDAAEAVDEPAALRRSTAPPRPRRRCAASRSASTSAAAWRSASAGPTRSVSAGSSGSTWRAAGGRRRGDRKEAARDNRPVGCMSSPARCRPGRSRRHCCTAMAASPIGTSAAMANRHVYRTDPGAMGSVLSEREHEGADARTRLARYTARWLEREARLAP